MSKSMSSDALHVALNHGFLDAISDFWFRHLKTDDHIIALDVEDAMPWFSQADAYDEECIARFGTQLELIQASQATAAGILAAAKPVTPLHWMSLIILLDQLPRNCFRRDRLSIAYTFFDNLALQIASQATELGIPKAPEVRFRLAYVFWFYMPLEHSENMDVQEELTKLHKDMWRRFEDLMSKPAEGLDADSAQCRGVLLKRMDSYERFKNTIGRICDSHKDSVERFGRFPARNEVLGRRSTEAELLYLHKP